MKKITRLTIVILLATTQFTFAQKKINLFNQKDLAGWYAYQKGTSKNTNANEVYSVENKMIRMYGTEAGYLMSEQTFKNFKLIIEFRWNTDSTFVRKNNKKNSGVMYLVPPEAPDELWPKGIQFQIKEGATGDFVLLQDVTLNVKGNKTVPGKSVTSKFFTDAEKPIGEWNTLKIISKNGTVQQKLNGKLVNKGTESSVSEGRILLQYEGFPIDFRKVIIQELK